MEINKVFKSRGTTPEVFESCSLTSGTLNGVLFNVQSRSGKYYVTALGLSSTKFAGERFVVLATADEVGRFMDSLLN